MPFRRVRSGVVVAACLWAPPAFAGDPSLSADGRWLATAGPSGSDFYTSAQVTDRASGATTMAGLTRGGAPAPSGVSDLDWSGRFVALQSEYRLSPADGNRYTDMYVHDRRCRTTELVPARGTTMGASGAVLSPDGRYVGFTSSRSVLVPGVGSEMNAYVEDRLTRTLERVSLSDDGRVGGAFPDPPALSAGGRYVAFVSDQPLTREDTDDDIDLYVRDRAAGRTERIPRPVATEHSWERPFEPAISADGRYVAFSLGNYGAWVHDRRTASAQRADLLPAGGRVSSLALSADGRRVAFAGEAGTPGDVTASGVWVRDLEQATMTRVASGDTGVELELSADGRWVAWKAWARPPTVRDVGSARPVPPVAAAEVPCRSPAAVVPYADLVRADGALAHWRLGEAAGATVARERLKGFDGTYDVPAGALGRAGALQHPGDADTALELPGAARGSVEVRRPELDFPRGRMFTVEAWIKPERLNTHTRRIVSGESAPAGRANATAGYLLGIRKDALVFSMYNDGQWATAQAPPPRTGEWAHVAGVYSGYHVSLFLNGRLAAERETFVYLPDRPGTFTIGAKQGRWKFFAGAIDEVAVYPRWVTQLVLDEHYQAGLGR